MDQQTTNNSVSVQLYGGGIDSVCLAHIVKPDIKLFFNLGTPENKFELERAKRAGCIVDNRLFLGDQVLPNKILPARNLLLVSMAAYYGNIIILGSTAGDTTRDKDQTFLDKSQDILDHILAHDPDKALPFHAHGISVLAPGLAYTKTELVQTYLVMGGDPQALLDSRSCYSADEHECGTCRSCVRKYVALRLNGLHPVFQNTPDLKEALAYAKARNRQGEIADIERIMQS